MLIPVWQMVIASLVTLIIGVGVGVVYERTCQFLRRREEMLKRFFREKRHMFIPFDGYCPECGKVCEELDFEYRGDFVVTYLVCTGCKDEFRVIYDNGKILKDK